MSHLSVLRKQIEALVEQYNDESMHECRFITYQWRESSGCEWWVPEDKENYHYDNETNDWIRK